MIDGIEPLSVFDKDEWWDVARRVNPHITQEEFDQQWEEFQSMKQRRELQ